MSVENELKRIADRMEEHEKRHCRERADLNAKQQSCSEKFEKIFDALGDSKAAKMEHKTRLNGLTSHEEVQDKKIDEVSKKIDKWFIGIIALAVIGYILEFIF